MVTAGMRSIAGRPMEAGGEGVQELVGMGMEDWVPVEVVTVVGCDCERRCSAPVVIVQCGLTNWAGGAERLVMLPGSVAERGALMDSEYIDSTARSGYSEGPAVDDTAPVVTMAAGRWRWPRGGGGTEKGAPVLPRGDADGVVVPDDGTREDVGAEDRGEAPVVMMRDSAGSAGRGERPGEGVAPCTPCFAGSRRAVDAPAMDSEAPAGERAALVEEVECAVGAGSEPAVEGPPRRMGGGDDGRGVEVGSSGEGIPVTKDGS